MKFKNFWRTCCLILISQYSYLPLIHAQENIYGKTIEFKKTEIHISEILIEFANQGISFSYKDNSNADDKLINLNKKKLTINEVLDLMVKAGYHFHIFKFRIKQDNFFIILILQCHTNIR